MTAPRASRAALLALAVTATLIVGAAVVGYRVAGASYCATEAVARNLRPSPAPMQASLLAEAVHPPEKAPSAAPDLVREQSLRVFQDTIANAWREGLAQAATATEETPTALAGPPIPTASANPPTVAGTPPTTAVADLPIATAFPNSLTEMAAPTVTATPPTTAAASTSATTAPMVAAALITTPEPPAGPATAAADAGPQDLRIVVYSASWCSACQLAKAWMTAHGIAFEERDIDVSTDYVQQLRLLNERMTIPTFDIDGNVMIGFNPRRLALMLQRARLRRAEGAR
jgi:mycoredoxin